MKIQQSIEIFALLLQLICLCVPFSLSLSSSHPTSSACVHDFQNDCWQNVFNSHTYDLFFFFFCIGKVNSLALLPFVLLSISLYVYIYLCCIGKVKATFCLSCYLCRCPHVVVVVAVVLFRDFIFICFSSAYGHLNAI